MNVPEMPGEVHYNTLVDGDVFMWKDNGPLIKTAAGGIFLCDGGLMEFGADTIVAYYPSATIVL